MIRVATPTDNSQLLCLTSSNPMQGIISLRIDRKPDFFKLLQARGESITYILEKEQQVIGSFSASKSQVFVNGLEKTLYYLSDLKVDNAYRTGVYAFKLISTMYQYLQAQGADLLFCTVVLGNNKVVPIFNGRASIPKFNSLGKFIIFQLLPSKKPITDFNFIIREQIADSALIKQFNCFYQQYQLGKIIHPEVKKLTALVAYRQKEVVAALTLLDTLPLKQNVVVGLQLPLKAMVYVSNALRKYLPLYRLPTVGEPVKTLYINNFYYQTGQQTALMALINQARQHAFFKQYHFVSIGLHEKDPLVKCFQSFRKFKFQSVGYITSLKNNNGLLDDIATGIPFEDYSLV